MKALVNISPDKLELQDMPLPEPGIGEARIRVTYCGICATDLEMITGWERTDFPAIPGHEWTGIVDAVGEGGTTSLIGKNVVAENIRKDGGEVGFEHPGGYGEYLIVEENRIHSLPADMPLYLAPLIEPLAVAVRGMTRLRFTKGENAIIFGDGPVGLLLLLLAKREQAGHVILVGGRPERLSIATGFGADMVINYHDTDITDIDNIKQQLPALPTVVMEASGSPSAMKSAMNLTATSGRILVIGDYGTSTADFNWNQLLHQELELIGSNASEGGWAEAVKIAAEEKENIAQLVTHRIPAKNAVKGIELMKDRTSGVIKIIMAWGSGNPLK